MMAIKKNNIVKPSHKRKRKAGAILQALFAIVVIALGVFVTVVLVKLKKPPQQIEQEVLAPLVKIERLEVKDIPMVVHGNGTVQPKVEVSIVPEVAGKVVYVHPELKVGGFIRADEKILQIDPRDYELAVQQADATVQDAKVKLDTELAEADVARKEWSQLNPGIEPTSPLVLREPQIRKARAALESAEAQLAVAKLKLERTSLSLPFDALIISEQVDLGQYIVAGQSLASAYGTEAVEIEVPLEDKELAWFDVFDLSVPKKVDDTKIKQATALVKANFAGAEHTWQGRVVRTTGQVDQTSRMIPIVVEVDKPFDSSEGKPPLLPGVFADVYIEGRMLKKALAIPRDAIREGDKVWLVNDNMLHIRTLNIVRTDKNFAYTSTGIDDGAQIITSSLDVAIEGMQIRTQGDVVEDNVGSVSKSDEPAGMEAE